MIQIQINHKIIEVVEGTTILQAARQAGIHIPTLCYLEKRDPLGACRVCLVEVAGARTLMAACSTPCAAGMTVQVNSPKARAARKQVVELLLSEHNGDCQLCERNEDCELRRLASDMGIREVTFQGARTAPHLDRSTAGLTRDNSKCIKCRRCVTICSQVQGVGALFPQGRGFATVIGPAFAADLEGVTCVQCGQCAAICPVAAITEHSQIDEVWRALEDPAKTVVVQTAPAIRAALGEEFGYPPGTRVTGKMVSALRQMGFAAVFDTNFAADLTILEEGTELLTRLKRVLVDKDQTVALPMFTSCSPGWINFVEYYYPDFLAHLSTCKSPQQMFGAVAKTFYAAKIGKKPEDLVVVAIMPCTAKKFEARREEMTASGGRDVDYVLTTRELARMIRQANLIFTDLPDGEMDAPLGLSSGAADIFANTGGVMEAALRTVYEIVTGRELPADNLHVKPIAGLEGLKEASLKIERARTAWSFLEGVEMKVAVAHGLGHARRLLEKIKSGEAKYHFVEVMACPGGCIGGGGQPRFTDDNIRRQRMAAMYAEDESKTLRKSHDNPAVQELYQTFLGKPLGAKSHELLHTHYRAKERR